MPSRQVLVVLAGYPGTGKSALSRRLDEELGPFLLLELDAIKEDLYDREGFVDSRAKESLNGAATAIFFVRLRRAMSQRRRIIVDYPFSDKQRAGLDDACRDFAYTPITVRLVAEFEALFARQHQRDLDPGRHPGHLYEDYAPGGPARDRRQAPGILSREEFLDRYRHRGYGHFSLGQTCELDTTHFEDVDTGSVVDFVSQALGVSPRTSEP